MREPAAKVGRGREQVLRGERTGSGRGGLMMEVGKELASDVLLRLLVGTRPALSSAVKQTMDAISQTWSLQNPIP